MKQITQVFLEGESPTLTILAKILILDAWLGPGRASADGYITVLKIHTKRCINGRQLKMESF